MVLVDTSVWIRFLANQPPYTSELDRLLDLEAVAGHDLIYGELLIGDKGGRKTLLAAYDHLHRLPNVSHSDVVDFIRSSGLHGRGIGWIDAHLLAASIVGRVLFWTADERLAGVAQEFGTAYTPA